MGLDNTQKEEIAKPAFVFKNMYTSVNGNQIEQNKIQHFFGCFKKTVLF